MLTTTMELWGLGMLLLGIGLFVGGLTIWGKSSAAAALKAAEGVTHG